MTLAITPAEASDFIKWALENCALSNELLLTMTAFIDARRAVFETAIEYAEAHRNELRGIENGCTPAEREKQVILGHKADKMDNVVAHLQELKENPTF